jgi:hypothetical protein
MDETYLLALLIVAGLTYSIYEFYWLRVLFMTLAMSAWFGFAIAAPLYFCASHFLSRRYLEAIVMLPLAGILGFIWFIGALGVLNWWKHQRQAPGGIFQPWNARND